MPFLLDNILNFGVKHRGEDINDIIEKDIHYCLWMREQDAIQQDEELYSLLKDLEEPPIVMPWGKHKGISIHDLYSDKREYLEWVKKSEFIQKNKRVYAEICKYLV